ncbi:hypothetical protein GNT69_08105 [Bacillus sp. B15-48]|nr:hypothetical protein [Bacillus sp. B15-48]
MKNRTSFYIVMGLIALAAIGIISQLINDPASFFKTIAIMAIVAGVIFFIVQRITQGSPTQKHEQHAFKKAAKKSKKRFLKKENIPSPSSKRSTVKPFSMARKKNRDTSHLTVIEGKKGKKKNRASF